MNKRSTYKDLERRITELELENQQLLQAKMVLRESEVQLDTILESIGDQLTLLDKDLNIIWANKVVKAFYGKEIIGKKCYHIYKNRTVQCENECHILKTFIDGKIHMRKHTFSNHEGVERDFHCVANVALKDKIGNSTAVIHTARDITEKFQVEEELAKANDLWERTFDSISDFVTICNKDKTIIKTNKAVREAFKADSKELKGKFCYEIFCGAAKPCTNCPGPLTSHDAGCHFTEIENEKLDRTFLVNTSPLLNNNGEIDKIVHTAKDITELKKLACQFRQAQKMESIGTLAGGIAHDFNNILGTILGYTDLCCLETPKESECMEFLQCIRQASLRAKDLVTQILSFSRHSETSSQPINIGFIIKETIKLLRATLPPSIEINTEINNWNTKVLADPTQIHQVLMNLCTNAYQAMMDKKGVLKLSLSETVFEKSNGAWTDDLKKGEYVLLQVKDSGHGIPTKIFDRIFDPYFTTKGSKGGTGLGLAVVHGIIKSHNGAITVNSKPGKGTVFDILLPKVQSTKEKSAKRYMSVTPVIGKGKVMIVEDEWELMLSGQKTLQRLGYDVDGRTCSIEALDIFKKKPHQVDIVLTDYYMPKMSGLDIAREMLLVRPDLPIILCSGFLNNSIRKEASAMGVKESLIKPLTMNELSRAVSRVLCKA